VFSNINEKPPLFQAFINSLIYHPEKAKKDLFVNQLIIITFAALFKKNKYDYWRTERDQE
jgi:hypothetical protein